MEDIRSQNEENKEWEDEWTSSKSMALKESKHSETELQMLLEENKALKRKLSISEEENGQLKADLQWGTEEIRQREQTISSLQHKLSERSHEGADEEIVHHHQTLQAQKEETDQMRSSLCNLEESGALLSSCEQCDNEMCQLRELLAEKDKEVLRANEKRRARVRAHIHTLILLTVTKESLEESKVKCDTMRQKLSETEEGFRKKLFDTAMKVREEMSELSESWEARALQWQQEKRELENKLLLTEKCWIQEEAQWKQQVQRLTEENVQPQVRCFCSSFPLS